MESDRVVDLPPPRPRGRVPLPPALRHRFYRNYWFGMLSAVGGFQMFLFGQLWLVHELTGSTIYLGFVGLANAIPAISLNLVGGVSADRFERRRLVVVTQVTSAVFILGLAVLTVTELVRPWHVLVAAALVGGVDAFSRPARLALYPHYVPRDVLMSAVALNASVYQLSRIAAPAVAGVVVALFGTAPAFFLAAGGMAFLALALRTTPDSISDEPQGNPVQKVIEGFRFIRAHPTMAFLIGMVFFNSFFGIAYIYMMPVFAVDVLDVGANGQGLLLGASGVGSLTTTLWFTTRKQVRRAGLVIGFGAVLTGAALAAFALTAEYVGSMVLALVLMYALGAFNSSYIMVTTTALQMAVPDELRGRVMGFFGMTWQIAPLGGMWAGFLATVIGAPWAVAVGGFGLMAFALGPALMNANFRRLSLTDGGASLVAESAR